MSFSQYPEAAIVYAAQTYEQLSDPNSWVRLSPDAQLDENLFFPASLEWARYIIVRDITNGESFNNSADGYDVDAIGACVIASEPPYTPPQEETQTTEEIPVETPPPPTTEEEEVEETFPGTE